MLWQRPEWDYLYFYYAQSGTWWHQHCCVNALNGATSISTISGTALEMQLMNCGNALKGATFISTTLRKKCYAIMQKLCQCPKRGNFHFYPHLRTPHK